MEKYARTSSIPKIIKKVLPAIVSITISKLLPVFEAPFVPPSSLPNHDKHFMIPKGKKKIKTGGGSGFIVDSSGIIITNRHVVSDLEADYIVVTNAEENYEAKVLVRDPIHDIAILKIEKKNLPTIELGDSSKLELGQTAIAIGNVLGTFKDTVSVGVVSGLSREISAGDSQSKKITKLRGLIQTDAAINPGNSGGPLIDMKGKAIGVNTAMVFLAENIGFALPINNAKRDLSDLKKYGRLRQPFLGVRYILLDKELKEKFNLPTDRGALVISEPIPEGKAVVMGSAGEKAGIKEGDVILEVQNIEVCNKTPVEDILQKCKIGQTINLKTLRNGKEILCKAILEERK
ncbi:MAG: trypsin-like peptidase domain-containing protein [Candidatus Nealsonbacteria bacterium]|nr:trypsin-like peptidase domain-containing protein [Candidatus Nealsonbacteria bacterium]